MDITLENLEQQASTLLRERKSDVRQILQSAGGPRSAGLLRALGDEELRTDVRKALRSARSALARLEHQMLRAQKKQKHRRRTAALIAAGIAAVTALIVASKAASSHATSSA